MSVIDSARPTTRRWTSRAQSGASTLTTSIIGWATQGLARAWHQLRINRPLRTSLVWGIAAWLILELAFVAWVHRTLEGESYRAFLPGTLFGVMDCEAAAGMQPVCKVGYDGQQYYRISNDVFGFRDAHKHVDGSYLYRYQRIGIPLLAGGLATLLGYEMTPPMLYHTLQFGITAAGFAALVYWLMAKRLHPAYALGWLLSAGTLISLWQGLLDSPADAFFVFTFLALLARRMWLYVPLATLLLLTREGYAVFAFAVFAAAILTRFAWQDTAGHWNPFVRTGWRDVTGYWQQVVLTALPGIVMLLWTAYLAIHFHTSPITARNNPDCTSWPYYMMVKWIQTYYRNANWFELRLALVSAFTLVLVSVALVRNWRRLPLALGCTAPYVLLTAALGQMVWEAYAGHMKASGTIIIIGLFMMPIDKSIVLRFMLALQAIVGVAWLSERSIVQPRILSPYLLQEESGYEPNPSGSPDNPLLNDLHSATAWSEPEALCQRKYHGIWDWIHREIKPITVAVTNHTDVTWQPGLGKHPIWLGYTLYNGSGRKQLCRRSVVLDKALAPGETKDFTTYLELRRPHKKYIVEFSVWQDGPGWFVRTDSNFGRRYEFTVE